MKLLLRRDQKSGLLGKIAFQLNVRAELTEEEKSNIKKYKLADTVLYEREKMKEGGSPMRMIGATLAYRMLNLIVQVKDLENGKQIEVKDIVEMLAVEEQLKEAAQTFKNILEAAKRFGGEEIVEIA